MKNPYEDARAERIAIVNTLELLDWVGYTTPPRMTHDDIKAMQRHLALRLMFLTEEPTPKRLYAEKRGVCFNKMEYDAKIDAEAKH